MSFLIALKNAQKTILGPTWPQHGPNLAPQMGPPGGRRTCFSGSCLLLGLSWAQDGPLDPSKSDFGWIRGRFLVNFDWIFGSFFVDFGIDFIVSFVKFCIPSRSFRSMPDQVSHAPGPFFAVFLVPFSVVFLMASSSAVFLRSWPRPRPF